MLYLAVLTHDLQSAVLNSADHQYQRICLGNPLVYCVLRLESSFHPQCNMDFGGERGIRHSIWDSSKGA